MSSSSSEDDTPAGLREAVDPDFKDAFAKDSKAKRKDKKGQQLGRHFPHFVVSLASA